MRKPRSAILLPQGLSLPAPRLAGETLARASAKAQENALELTLKALTRANIKRTCIVIHHRTEEVKEKVGSGKQWGLEVVYAPQAEPLGSADALLSVLRKQPGWISRDEPVLVTASDYFMKPSLLAEIVEGYARSGCDIAMNLEARRSQAAEAYPGVLPGENGRVHRILEKTAAEEHSSFEASLIYVLPPEIWEQLPVMQPPAGSQFELAHVVSLLLQKGFTACGIFQPPSAWDTGLFFQEGKPV